MKKPFTSRSGPKVGTNVVWARGVEARYDISTTTRWRWEKLGKLPPRDINIGGKTGWKPSTLDTADGTTASVA